MKIVVTVLLILALFLVGCAGEMPEKPIPSVQEKAKEETFDKDISVEKPETEIYGSERIEHKRPSEYDVLELTEETAYSVLCKAREMQIRLMLGGDFEGLNVCPYYDDRCELRETRVYTDYDDENQYLSYYCQIIYYIPELDTYEKFNKYFLTVFTDDTVRQAVSAFNIAEIDGKLALENIGYNHLIFERNWDDMRIVDIKQEDGAGTAVVTASVASDTGDHRTEFAYTFEYSEKYGWRVALGSFSSDM